MSNDMISLSSWFLGSYFVIESEQEEITNAIAIEKQNRLMLAKSFVFAVPPERIEWFFNDHPFHTNDKFSCTIGEDERSKSIGNFDFKML